MHIAFVYRTVSLALVEEPLGQSVGQAAGLCGERVSRILKVFPIHFTDDERFLKFKV